MFMLDLFSGIGGITLAAEWAGIETVAFCEIDPYCQKVLRKHWPDVPIFDDVRKLTKQTLIGAGVIDDDRTIDLISAGYPCQPFSVAGKRGGAEDDRHLWPEVFRLIKELRPTWVLGENVAGHVTLGLDDVLADLESIGYTAQAFVVPACAVGAPHRRDRVFIVAYSNSKRHDGSGRETSTFQNSDGEKDGLSMPDGENVAHSASERCGETREHCGRYPERPTVCGETLAHTCGAGCEECDTAGKPNRPGYSTRGAIARRTSGPTQSRVGRDFARISSGMDSDRLKRGGNSALSKESGPDQILSALRETAGAQEVQRKAGRSERFSEPKVLQSELCKLGATEGRRNSLSIPQESGEVQKELLRDVWLNRQSPMPPFRWESAQQYGEQCRDIVQLLSHEMALEAWEKVAEETVGLQNLWAACTEIGYVPETLSALQKVWQSLSYQEKSWAVVRASGRIPWPAGLGQPQYDWEPPRVAAGVRNRVARLRALGNAVVPQQVYPILAAIKYVYFETDQINIFDFGA